MFNNYAIFKTTGKNYAVFPATDADSAGIARYFNTTTGVVETGKPAALVAHGTNITDGSTPSRKVIGVRLDMQALLYEDEDGVAWRLTADKKFFKPAQFAPKQVATITMPDGSCYEVPLTAMKKVS